MAGSQTLRFDIIGDGSSATRAFRDTATGAALAARGAKQLSDTLAIQSKTTRASADATLSLAKSDDILAAAEAALAGSTDEATGSLGAMKLKLDELNGKVAAARVSLDGDKEAQAQLDAISSRLTDLDHKTSTPDLDIQGVAKATAELSAVDVALDKVGGQGGSAAGAESSLGLLASPMGALVGAGVALAPVLLTVGTGLGGLAAAAVSTVTPILAAGTATKAQQQALAGLDPAQRAAYTSLGALKTQFSGFSKALEPEVISVFNQGIKLAGGLLDDVEPVAASTGKALSGLVGDIGADLKTQQWQSFFGFMAQSAGPDIQLVGSLFINLLNDLPQLLEELQPVAQGLLTVASDAALALKALDTLNPSLSATSVQAAAVQQNSGNMFTRFLASSKVVISDITGIGKVSGDAATGTMSVATASDSLGDSLVALEARYGLTAAQAQALVTAAGSSDQALAAGGASARTAMTAIEGYANANLAAKTPTQQLAGDVAVLGNNTLGAAAQLTAFTNAWDILVGNSVSDQQAVLATSQAFQALLTEVKNSGSQSLASQSDFLAYVSSIGQGVSTLQKNGATVATVNAYYQTNIDRLNSLHNLTPAQRADIQGLTKDYDTWANSTAGLNSQTATAAGTIKNAFTANLKSLGDLTPGISGDVNNLAASVLKTGTTSASTAGDRAKLIADLRQSGLSAADARAFVDNLQTSINDLKGKTVNVGVTASASGTITVGTQGLSTNLVDSILLRGIGSTAGLAAGGMVTAGTTPTADDVLVRVSKHETIVSAADSKILAPAFAAVGVPGYAAGGLPGLVPGTAAAVAAGASKVMSAESTAVTQSLANAILAQQAAAAKAAAAAFTGSGGAGGGIIQAMMQTMAAARGWTGAELTALFEVEAREAGFNMTATNPTSGAYGLAQFINGPSEYAQYGGNSTTAQGQITGMLNYIAQRYGDPIGAEAHEVAYGWYDRGGMLKPGLTLAYNGTGRPEQVIPGGGGGGAVHVKLELGDTFRRAGLTSEQLADIRATVNGAGGNVQRAFGRS